MKRIFTFFFIFRLTLFLPLLVGAFILPYRGGFEYTNIWKFTKPYFPVEHVLLYPWANFDGVHYLSIAGQGYNLNGRFLPAYPIIIHSVSLLFGTGEPFGFVQFMVAFFISNIAFILALYFLHKLLQLDYKKNVIEQTILLILLFPTSFFFVNIYSESLFLLLSVLSFYFARKNQWILASICASLLSITRVVGIFIIPALLLELIKQENILKNWRKKKIELLAKIFPLIFSPISLIIYAFYNQNKWHDFLYFIHNHTQLANGRSSSFVLPFQTVFRYLKILFTATINFEWWIALFELATLFFTVGLFIVAWKKQVRISYLIFAALCFLVPISSGTFTSLPRYSVVLFPLFVGFAMVKNKYIKLVYYIISPILLFVLLLFFSRGFYVA